MAVHPELTPSEVAERNLIVDRSGTRSM